ncbi:MAG: putative signaling protein [Clostridia bacterium]|jgi:EAL domain-containing protein (putative c-di-GMP-specific phosphodiesterase class I)/GGDEF domain-containing protein|nr:putative signaling protein [Clostridia bacterium]
MSLSIWNSLQILLVILVLVALAAYNFLGLYQFLKEKSMSSIILIEHILSFSLLWLTESLFIVLTYVYITSIKAAPLTRELLAILVIIFVITLFLTLSYFGNKKSFALPLTIIILAINGGLALVIALKVPLLIILKLTLLFYVLIFLVYTFFTYKLANKISLIRTYYGIFCVILLLIINLLQYSMDLSFYLIFNLCVCFFLTISFCLYYAEAYTSKLLVTTKNIEFKDSELLEAEKRIQFLAYTHPDSGLKNSHKLHVDLKNFSGHLTGMCMLNIKNFKLLLTLIGYRESKSILQDIAKALILNLNLEGDLYHFSTDRFIILYKGSANEFETFINSVLSVFSENNLCTIDLNPCIGAAYIHDMPLNYDTLIQELELASHVSKNLPCHYALYMPEMSETLQSNLDLESKLKEATRDNHWEVYFQPKVNVINNQIIGAEALIRWRDNETTITPNIFIPLAEKLGLISQIGRYVIDTTFKYVGELESLGYKELRFSINLSVQQLMELDLVDFIEQCLIKYNISSKYIIFEVTESVLIHNITKANTTITKLKSLGFRLSLDDFGTGYSSLAYLSKLNFDELKFDREFIRNIDSEQKNRIILECVTRMGQDLGLDIVTEGIEDESQYNTIKSLGCNYYQGYYYSKPIPFNNFLSLLELPSL